MALKIALYLQTSKYRPVKALKHWLLIVWNVFVMRIRQRCFDLWLQYFCCCKLHRHVLKHFYICQKAGRHAPAHAPAHAHAHSTSTFTYTAHLHPFTHTPTHAHTHTRMYSCSSTRSDFFTRWPFIPISSRDPRLIKTHRRIGTRPDI